MDELIEMSAFVLGAKRGNIDGEPYSSIQARVEKPNEKDRVGWLVTKGNCNYDLIDDLDKFDLPCDIKFGCRVDIGAGGKPVVYYEKVLSKPGDATTSPPSGPDSGSASKKAA